MSQRGHVEVAEVAQTLQGRGRESLRPRRDLQWLHNRGGTCLDRRRVSSLKKSAITSPSTIEEEDFMGFYPQELLANWNAFMKYHKDSYIHDKYICSFHRIQFVQSSLLPAYSLSLPRLKAVQSLCGD